MIQLNLSDEAYLAGLTPLLNTVIEHSCEPLQSEPPQHIEQFASSFLANLETQGALVPKNAGGLKLQHSTSLLGLLLTHHRRTPTNPIAWFNIAVTLRVVATVSPIEGGTINLHRLALAANACTKSLGFHSDAIRVWTELGVILHRLREPEQALGVFKQALQIKPKDPPLWLWSAFTLETLGRRSDALRSIGAARRNYAAGPEELALSDLFQKTSDTELLNALMQRTQTAISELSGFYKA